MTPYPPVPGTNVTVTTVGTQDETVTSGTWVDKIYYGIFPVQTLTGNVCDLIPKCPCPCGPGTYTSIQYNPVPSYAPSGSYSGQYTAEDQNGNELSCISYTFQI